MKAKIISIIISGLCFSGFTHITYAEDYNSPQSPTYRPPQSPSGHPTVVVSDDREDPSKRHHRDTHHQREERKGVSISINVPSYGKYVVEKNDRYFVPAQPERRHHHHSRGPEWVDMRDGMPIPPDAIPSGFERRHTLYVCRGNYRGGVHPGKVIGGRCNISWGGNEIALSHYQILTSNSRLNWMSVSYGPIPVNAVPGGYEHGQPLYICQAEYHGGLHPGKVVGQMCNIGWGGREVAIPYYNVLVE